MGLLNNCHQELYLLNEEKMEMFEWSAIRSIPEGLNQTKWPKNKRIYTRLTNPKQEALGLSSVLHVHLIRSLRDSCKLPLSTLSPTPSSPLCIPCFSFIYK